MNYIRLLQCIIFIYVHLLGLALTMRSRGMTKKEPIALVNMLRDCDTERIDIGACM